jgi:cation transport regulator
MPYKTLSDLPEVVRKRLPIHGQHIYIKAFNNAWKEYKDPTTRWNSKREPVAHAVAWSAVEKKYEKNSKGKWVKIKGK